MNYDRVDEVWIRDRLILEILESVIHVKRRIFYPAKTARLGTYAYLCLRNALGSRIPLGQVDFEMVVSDGEDVWSMSVVHDKFVPKGDIHLFDKHDRHECVVKTCLSEGADG